MENKIRRYNVLGARTFSNYWWGTILVIVGFSFLIVGLSSYYLNFFDSGSFLEKNSKTFFFSVDKILFFPQGLSMCFYGFAAILLGIYLWFCIFLQIGCGFTEFNKKTCTVKIFRLGFPGKNRIITYSYSLTNILGICVKIPSNNLTISKPGVYMRLKLSDKITRDVPVEFSLTKTSLESIELYGADLSKFLQVSLSIL